ncbi:hypothetical protein [Sporolactobacillus vineae]|uniref:hypothetical protein n=1 Tax=Sporolactobacillus vineae TaxID=444463 RepID=UPI000289645F|nr:hypothetical protein [Sporolactobacillus vineae]
MFPFSSFILADIIFPIFMLYFYPPLLGLAASANLIIDAVVFFATLRFFHITMKNRLGTLIALWLLGLAADVAGSLFLSLTLFVNNYIPQVSINYYTIYSSPAAVVLIVSAIILAGLIIYLLDRIYLRRRLPAVQAKRMALVFAIATAPYTFLISANWFIGA